MGRTDNDSWEITESVGATALGVAAARAAETESENPLISDPFARVFLRAAALRETGFDASAPSAWSAEGLLPFLPAAAQELLFERVQALSAAGSRIAVEAPGPDFNDQTARDRQRRTMQRVRDMMAELDPQRDIPDVQDLWYFEDREDVGDWLRRHDWNVTVTPAEELMAGYHRRPRHDVEDAAPATLFVAAERTGAI